MQKFVLCPDSPLLNSFSVAKYFLQLCGFLAAAVEDAAKHLLSSVDLYKIRNRIKLEMPELGRMVAAVLVDGLESWIEVGASEVGKRC